MVEKQSISNDLIITCLHTKYGINITTLTLLPLGADINASVYKAEAHDHTTYFVKLKRGYSHDISVTILHTIAQQWLDQANTVLKQIDKNIQKFIQESKAQ